MDKATKVSVTLLVTHESGRVTEWRVPEVDISNALEGHELNIETKTALRDATGEYDMYRRTEAAGIGSLEITLKGKPIEDEDGHWMFQIEHPIRDADPTGDKS